MTHTEKLSQRTINIIQNYGKIVLKKNDWYLSSWTNIASGPDNTVWGWKRGAQEFFNLDWAFAIAKLYGAKVVVLYPKKK